MTKQDLTAEQIENFRSYCHAYLEKIGPTHALIDRVCDLARKGIEAQKPEPGEREAMSRAELDQLSRRADRSMERLKDAFGEAGGEAVDVEGLVEEYKTRFGKMGWGELDALTSRMASALTKLSQERDVLKRSLAVSDFRVREQDEFIQLRAVKELELEAERDRLSLEVGRLKELIKFVRTDPCFILLGSITQERVKEEL